MTDHEVICLSDSEDEKLSSNKENIANKELKVATFKSDEVQIVDPPPAASIPLHSSTALQSDDELEIVGLKNTTKLPHNRHDCLECRYVPLTDLTQLNSLTSTSSNDDGRRNNRKFCSLCYCYVCDKKAEECVNWFLGGRGELVEDGEGAAGTDGTGEAGPLKSVEETEDDNNSSSKPESKQSLSESTGKTTPAAASSSNNTDQYKPHKNHCQACDTGPLKSFWYNMRLAVREGRDPSTITLHTNHRSQGFDSMQRYIENYGNTLQNAMALAQARSSSRARSSSANRRRARSQPSSRSRRRTRPRNGSLTPSDHRERIRAQNMLESLYQNPDSWS